MAKAKVVRWSKRGPREGAGDFLVPAGSRSAVLPCEWTVDPGAR